MTRTYTFAYTCTAGCSGVWIHTMNVEFMDIETGEFTGTGFYNANPSYTWTVEGVVDGSSIEYTIVYTGTNAGYWVQTSGTIAPDGSMSGTAWSYSQMFVWETSNGAAQLVDEDGDGVMDWADICPDTRPAQRLTGRAARSLSTVHATEAGGPTHSTSGA